MSLITAENFEILLPLASAWALQQESVILRTGVTLTTEQIADARQIGVAHPDKVRLLRVAAISSPQHPILAAAAQATGLISPATAGLTLRYGIFVREDCWGNRHLVVHELVHTVQYERLGGVDGFLRMYLKECLTPPGYPHGPMEQESVTTANRIAPISHLSRL